MKPPKKKGDVHKVSEYGGAYDFPEGYSAYTQHAGSCVIYGLKDKNFNSGFLGHYNKYPEILIKVLENNDVNANGFMIGGDSYCEDKYYKKTLEVFKTKNIKTTIFYGQNSYINSTNVFFDIHNDTVYITAPDKVERPEDIKNLYRDIKIADCDEVYINDEKINPKTIEK